METMTATTIDDDSNNECNADDDGDNGADHNGNNDKATMTRPQQRDHDNKITMRYNNQLNGGPLVVDCNDDNDDNGNSDGNGNGNGDGEGDGDGEGNGGSTRCNDNNNVNNNSPFPVIIDVVVIQRLCLCRAVMTTMAAGRQDGSCRWQGGDGNSNRLCCNDDDIDHIDDHPLPAIVDVFVIWHLSLCGARLTMAVGWRRGSGC